jgi:hypothetical protein
MPPENGTSVKTLVWDCEMQPGMAYIWDLKIPGGYINRDMLISRKKLLCVAAKWVGEEEMFFFSSWDDGDEGMTRGLWDLLDECDASVTFNGQMADEKWAATEFAVHGLPAPSPYKSIDLYRTVKSRFGFMSSSLGSQKINTRF